VKPAYTQDGGVELYKVAPCLQEAFGLLSLSNRLGSP
jgi:hypothetical protein